MAIMGFTGFESGPVGADELILLDASASISTSTVRTGARSLRCNPTAATTGFAQWTWLDPETGRQDIAIDSFPSGTTFYFVIHFRAAALPALASRVLTFSSPAGGSVGYLEVSALGALTAVGSTTSASAGTIVAGTWHRIEGKVVVGGGGGTSEIKLDGAAAVTWQKDAFAVGMLVFGSPALSTFDFFYDDVAVSDSGYIGACAVGMLRPNASGTVAGWTSGTGGSTFAEVDDVPASSASYIQTTVNDPAPASHLFNLESSGTGGISGTILAVQAGALIDDNTSLDDSTMALRIKSGSTYANGPDIAMPASNGFISKVWETDPATGAAWATSAIDALEAGFITGNDDTAYIGSDYVGEMFVGMHINGGASGGQRVFELYLQVLFLAAAAEFASPGPLFRYGQARRRML